MIDGLKRYPAMKGSGALWLGDVPAHWSIRPLKHWVRMNVEVLPESTAPEHEFAYVDIGSVGTGVLTQRPQRLQFGTAPSRARRVVHNGDTIVSTVRTYLKAIYHVDGIAEQLICSTGFAVLTPDTATSPKFVSYLAQSSPFTDRVTADAVGIAYPAIAETRLASFHVAVPPLAEQAAIVRFLDHADRRIRRYIRARQKLIKLLEEQKQAIIHRAVTRGLDPNVRLKPSGVEWLGEVPEHWLRVPMRQLARRGRSTFVNGPFGSDLLTSELTIAGVPVIYIRDISRGSYRRVSKACVTVAKSASLEFCQVTGGDVLVAKVGDPPGTAAIYPTDEPDGIVTQDVIRIRPDMSRVIAGYLVTYLNSRAGRIAVGPVVVESTRGRVSLPDFRAVPVVLPPLAEQQAILDEIATITEDIGAAVGKAQREVDLLREYRTRLIADVVTGKLDVREAAARLPDESDEPEPLDAADAEPDTDDPADDVDAAAQEAEA